MRIGQQMVNFLKWVNEEKNLDPFYIEDQEWNDLWDEYFLSNK